MPRGTWSNGLHAVAKSFGAAVARMMTAATVAVAVIVFAKELHSITLIIFNRFNWSEMIKSVMCVHDHSFSSAELMLFLTFC